MKVGILGIAGLSVSEATIVELHVQVGLSSGSLDKLDIRCDAVGLGELLLVVDIDLGECDEIRAGELGRQRVIRRCNSFAWSAPIGVDYSSIRPGLAIALLVRRERQGLGGAGSRGGKHLQSATTRRDELRSDVNCSFDEISMTDMVKLGGEGA
jgi:hypothetical protein